MAEKVLRDRGVSQRYYRNIARYGATKDSVGREAPQGFSKISKILSSYNPKIFGATEEERFQRAGRGVCKTGALHMYPLPERLGVPARWGDPARGYSGSQTAHSSRKPRAGTPSRAGTPCPLPLAEEVQKGGGVPARRGVRARRGVWVPARGILRCIRGQEAWEYHEPGPPNEPGPIAFSHAPLPLRKVESTWPKKPLPF